MVSTEQSEGSISPALLGVDKIDLITLNHCFTQDNAIFSFPYYTLYRFFFSMGAR